MQEALCAPWHGKLTGQRKLDGCRYILRVALPGAKAKPKLQRRYLRGHVTKLHSPYLNHTCSTTFLNRCMLRRLAPHLTYIGWGQAALESQRERRRKTTTAYLELWGFCVTTKVLSESSQSHHVRPWWSAVTWRSSRSITYVL